MTADEALAILDTLLKQQPLNNAKELVFRQAWEKRTYEEMANILNYEINYIKHIGSQLFLSISQTLGRKVTKSNLHSVFRQLSYETCLKPSLNASPQRQDWGTGVQEMTVFYGRQAELGLLEQWLVQDACRLVVISGTDGVGKTALTLKLAQQIQGQFDYLIWRSLESQPSLEALLLDLIGVFDHWAEKPLPASSESLMSQLLTYLAQHRCLLILDNFESVLASGTYAGTYREDYQGYQTLLQRLATAPHQSCLMVTTQEKPQNVTYLESETSQTRCLQLTGLTIAEGEALLQEKGLIGNQEQYQQLIERYRGNPVLLKLASSLIQEWFESNLAEFLKLDIISFGSIGLWLEQQLHRLTTSEEQLLYWLAIEREPMTASKLLQKITPSILPDKLLALLESLQRRSVIEKQAAKFILAPVLREYLIKQFIEKVTQEIATESLNLLLTHNICFIVDSLKQRLCFQGESEQKLLAKLETLLANVARQSTSHADYARDNLLNLLQQFQKEQAASQLVAPLLSQKLYLLKPKRRSHQFSLPPPQIS